MPFEIPQQEPQIEVKVGPFDADADAILRGCAMSEPRYNKWAISPLSADEKQACVLGAWCLGMRGYESRGGCGDWTGAYIRQYGATAITEYENKRFTREEIAERVRALR